MADTYQQITDVSSVIELEIPDGARSVLVQAEAKSIRYRQDGGDPSSTIGNLLTTGKRPTLISGNLSLLRLIEAESGAVLNCHFQ